MWGELRDLGGRKGRAGNWIIYWWDDWFAACASGREKQPDFRAVLRAAELLVSQIYGFWLYLCSACPFSWVTWDVVVLSACLGKPLLFLPHPCNGKFLQSLHGASLNDVSSPRLLAPDPSASAHFGTSWVCSTVGWGGAICLEVIPYLLKAFTSSVFWPDVPPWLLWAFLTGLQYPSPSWVVSALYRCSRRHYSTLVFPFFHCVSAMMWEQDGLCLLKHQLFLLSGRKEWDQSFHISTFIYLVFCPKSVRVCGSPGNESANLGAGNRLTWF